MFKTNENEKKKKEKKKSKAVQAQTDKRLFMCETATLVNPIEP